MNGYYLFVHLSNLPVLLVAIYAMYCYARIGKPFKKFSLFLYLNAFIQSLSLLLNLLAIPNLPLLHILAPLGFYLLASFYNSLLEAYLDNRLLNMVAWLFVLASGINTLFFQPVTSFNSNALTLEAVLLVILSISLYLFLLQQQLGNTRDKKIQDGLHWINSGIFIYQSSNLIIFYFGKLIIERFSREFALYTWLIHAIVSTIMYFCFFMGLWKQPKN